MSTITGVESREIGDFIRRRRMRTRAAEIEGVARKLRRKVPYLTQEELAALMEVSTEAVAKVERYRYPSISRGLLDRFGDVLQFSESERLYLSGLLETSAEPKPLTREIPEFAAAVVDESGDKAAVLINPCFDILYWNQAAVHLVGDFAQIPPNQRNIVVSMFCDHQMRERWIGWHDNAVALVAGIKMQWSQEPDYRAQISRLVDHMRAVSEQFDEMWKHVDPFMHPPTEKEYIHPTAGRLRLYQTVSKILDASHLMLVQYSPQDEETAEALARLQSGL